VLAQHPEEYDGILAAAPAVNWTKFWSFLWCGLEPAASFSGPFSTAHAVAAGEQGVTGVPFLLPHDWIKWWLEKDPAWLWRTATFADFERWFEQSQKEYDAVLATDDPDLRPFRDAGGKVLIWHGWADNLVYPRGMVDYCERVIATVGDRKATGEFARLFMAPGVGHCSGGAGPKPVDSLGALVDWVEGRAPQAAEHAASPEGQGQPSAVPVAAGGSLHREGQHRQRGELRLRRQVQRSRRPLAHALAGGAAMRASSPVRPWLAAVPPPPHRTLRV
jgi:hypothetical protein